MEKPSACYILVVLTYKVILNKKYLVFFITHFQLVTVFCIVSGGSNA